MQDLPAPASMLHFGTARAFLCKARGASVPFPLRMLHLNVWIPAFAENAPRIGQKYSGGNDGVAWEGRRWDSSLDMKKPP